MAPRPVPKNELRIREVKPGKDDDKLWKILEPVFSAGEDFFVPQDASKEEGLAFWVGGDHQSFLAELPSPDGTLMPVGTLLPPSGEGMVPVATASFVTLSDMQHRGICRRMLGEAVQIALGQSYRAMHLDCVVSSAERAVSFFTQAGFVEVGRIPGAFGHPTQGYVDVLQLYKRLDEKDLAQWLREVKEIRIREASPEKPKPETVVTPPAAEDDYVEIVPAPQNDPGQEANKAIASDAPSDEERRPASPVSLAERLRAESPKKAPTKALGSEPAQDEASPMRRTRSMSKRRRRRRQMRKHPHPDPCHPATSATSTKARAQV